MIRSQEIITDLEETFAKSPGSVIDVNSVKSRVSDKLSDAPIATGIELYKSTINRESGIAPWMCVGIQGAIYDIFGREEIQRTEEE